MSRQQKPMITVRVFLIHLFFLINPSIVSSRLLVDPFSRISNIDYSDHCISIVPESAPTTDLFSPHNSPQFSNGYYISGDKLINSYPQSSEKFLEEVSFRPYYPVKTNTEDIIKLYGVLTFRNPSMYPSVHSNVTVFGRSKIPMVWNPVRYRVRFYLKGFWSQSSGKLCMVGSATRYVKEGKEIKLYAVFKLNYPQNSTITSGFVHGTLESVNKTGSLNYFEPVSMIAFSQMNYDYTLILNETKSGFSSWDDGMKGLSLSSAIDGNLEICTVLGTRFELEYKSGCRHCSPIGGENGFLPRYMSFSDIQCSEEQRLRMLIGFYNSSFMAHDQPSVLDRMMVGEGAWDAEKNRLHLVLCRILNATGSLVNYSVGDCSIRLSLRFPAILSLKTRSMVVGQLWSNRTTGYFDRIRFRSNRIRSRHVPGLIYQYTESVRGRKSCVEQKIGRDKRKQYPGPNSYDLKFDIRVGNDSRRWGYARPLTVGDRFYEKSNGLMESKRLDSAVSVNISYLISFRPPTSSRFAGQLSYPTMYPSWSHQVDIAAEGIYNPGTGSLCMIGCRFLGSKYHTSVKNSSTDCEILISIQFPEINAKQKNYVTGSIQSTRGNSDSLYFDRLEFASLSLSRTQVVEAEQRMDLEILMLLFANTLICVFVASQLFYVKKHPDVLPSISVVMLVILTLGHLIPLVLNFEALFLANRNRQNVLASSAGWIEVYEVIVRVTTMIAFLLQFYLLQLTWSSRLGDGNKKALWLAEMKALFVFLPLCLVSGFIAWLVHWLSNSYKTPGYTRGFPFIFKYHGHSIWGDLRYYAGLLLDAFLLPQILLNVVWNSKDKVLSPAFYFGTTAVRLLPHAYDIYRAHSFAPSSYEKHIFYANPQGDLFSTAWDIIIPCVIMLFATVNYFQQRFGGLCILPRSFRASFEYEKVPVVSAAVTGERLRSASVDFSLL